MDMTWSKIEKGPLNNKNISIHSIKEIFNEMPVGKKRTNVIVEGIYHRQVYISIFV